MRDPAGFVSAAATLGVPLDDGQVARFTDYGIILSAWNERLNLTSVSVEDYPTLHYLDSLSVLRFIPPAAGQRLIDLGAGAGLPGIPLAIARPELSVTLLESQEKKVRFLESVISELGLWNVTAVQGRAELEAHRRGHREQYDYAIARALAGMTILAELLLPFIKVSGVALAMKGADVAAELNSAADSLTELRAEVTLEEITVPGLAAARSVVLLRKSAPLDSRFPRSMKHLRREKS